MPQQVPLPPTDEHSDEDTLAPGIVQVTPILRGAAHPRIGLGPNKVRCRVSIGDAVVQDRR